MKDEIRKMLDKLIKDYYILVGGSTQSVTFTLMKNGEEKEYNLNELIKLYQYEMRERKLKKIIK